MFWQKQTTMERNPGTPGVYVLLADRSTSMNYQVTDRFSEVIPEFRRAIPGLRVFGFHADLAEIHPGEPNLALSMPARGTHKTNGGYCNSTYLGYCLEKIARLKPSRTIVISDGGVADMTRALKAADDITGDIEAYFCPSWRIEWQDEGFMRDLARRGRGRFIEYGKTDVRQELITILRQRRFHYHQLPDQHIYLGRRG